MRKRIYFPMSFISVVIPTYNEAKNIIPLLERVSSVLKKTKETFEIIVVDDNSPDGTGDLVTNHVKTHPYIRLLMRTKDPGLGKSIGEGIRHAKGNIIIGMDADFNHDPKTIPLLLQKMKHADMVVASRFMQKGGMDDSFRFLPTYLFNKATLFFGFPNTDNTSGFYAIKKEVIDTLGIDRIYYGYGDYHLRLVYCTKKQGYSIMQVPTYYQKRMYGNSKSKLIQMGIAYAKEIITLRFFPTV